MRKEALPTLNLASRIARQARSIPDRTAIVERGAATTFGDLYERSTAAAGAFATLGIGPGDRVAALLSNRREYVEALFACARIGAVLVPLSPRLAAPELAAIVADCEPGLLVYERAHEQAAARLSVPQAVAVEDGYESAAGAAAIVDVDADEVLTIFYTSGTSGEPKGVMLTHGNFLWANINIIVALDLTHDERALVVLPMFHIGGWNVLTLPVLWKGGRIVLEAKFDAGRALDLVAAGDVTAMAGVPAMFAALSQHPEFEHRDLSGLRICISGGAALPPPLAERFRARGVVLQQAYGLTEAGPNVLLAPRDVAATNPGSAGVPYAFTEVAVVGDDDLPADPGELGEIVVRGPTVMRGYWRRPEATEKALRDGWLRTGDIGRVDAEGYFYVVDRTSDMYVSGGENVYPAEVEKALMTHPAVADAAVVGVPDATWGESGKAFVVLATGAAAGSEELVAHLRRRVAGFKIPSSFEFVSSLPRSATGKLRKDELRRKHL